MALGYVEQLVNINTAGTLYNTYTTAKSILTSATSTGASAGVYTAAPNFWTIGKQVRATLHCGISNRVTGPDTFTVQFMVGAVIAFTTGAINLTTTAHTTLPCKIVIDLVCRSVGNGTLATLMGQAALQGIMVAQAASLADNAGGTGITMAPLTAPAVGTGFDSTVVNTFDIFVAQSVSNAGNGIQLQQYTLEALN